MTANTWVSPDGKTKLRNVHDPSKCEGRGCSIHHPSDHHMRDWPMVWRDWHQHFERQCPHGIGHPDPDDIVFQQSLDPGNKYLDVHGCDGCCYRPEKKRGKTDD